MKLGHIEIFVSNPIDSKEFYINVLGFELVTVQSDDYIWLKSGDVEFLLKSKRIAPISKTYQESASAFVLYTDDLDKTLSKLREKNVEVKGNDGSEMCPTFTDLDGNWFQLVNPNEH